MRETKFEYPFAEIHGAIEKHGSINRKKTFRDANGRILREGKQEHYHVANPRDFTKNPQTPAERAHHERFREASNRAIAIIHAIDPSTYPSPELLEQLSIWQTRFNAQLITKKGSKPDPEAPLDPATGQGKRYVQLHAFIRAIIYKQLKTSAIP